MTINELLSNLKHGEEIILSRSNDRVAITFNKRAADGTLFSATETMSDLYMGQASVDVVYLELNRLIEGGRKAVATRRPVAP